ncbi:MAG TPA: hypothetical protein VJ327_11295 [Patescibacteria group bacterium]|nr:hypothetical protein [Patescibacteria group bacterium]
MTISNGSLIAAADLNAAHSAALTSLAASNLFKPTQVPFNVVFRNITTTSTAPNKYIDLVMSDDFILTEATVTIAESNAETWTVTIDNSAMIEPITLTGATTSTYHKLPRYYGTGALATGKPVQVLLKGSILTVNVSTSTDVAGPSVVSVDLLLESKIRRY